MSELRSKDELREGGISLLGNTGVKYSTDYDPSILETFDNKHLDNDYTVTFDAYEGSSSCPITHQPDMFKLVLTYIPNIKMVESKSMKLYLFSFRNHGDFHEDVTNIIMKDLIALMDPKYIEIRMIFSPRGGISIFPFANWANPDFGYQDLAYRRKLDIIRDCSNRTVKYDS